MEEQRQRVNEREIVVQSSSLSNKCTEDEKERDWSNIEVNYKHIKHSCSQHGLQPVCATRSALPGSFSKSAADSLHNFRKHFPFGVYLGSPPCAL